MKTRITEWIFLSDHGEDPTWVLEEDLGEFLGWKDIAYVDAPNKNAAREALKKKLCKMVDEAE